MIAIGSDHGGIELKTEVIKLLNKLGYEVKDFGTHDEKSVDYPDFAFSVTQSVCAGECEKGIVICGSGIGISIAANKVPGIRAALCTDSYMARMSREHNDANILALGQRVIGLGVALDIVESWLNTEFAGGRHSKRVEKIKNIEEKFMNGSDV